jgi:hypothetical protein
MVVLSMNDSLPGLSVPLKELPRTFWVWLRGSMCVHGKPPHASARSNISEPLSPLQVSLRAGESWGTLKPVEFF